MCVCACWDAETWDCDIILSVTRRGHGLSFLCAQSRLAALLSGTGFDYPPGKLELVWKLASEGYSWICWKGMMDVSAMGRQLHKDRQRSKAASVACAFANLAKTGWRAPARRMGFRYFDNSAYAVFRTADFMASVRASTPKIIGTETHVNEDNAKGMCMADGALMTYVTGREYENIFPLWDDWRMIPGVTAYRMDSMQMCKCVNDHFPIYSISDNW